MYEIRTLFKLKMFLMQVGSDLVLVHRVAVTTLHEGEPRHTVFLS